MLKHQDLTERSVGTALALHSRGPGFNTSGDHPDGGFPQSRQANRDGTFNLDPGRLIPSSLYLTYRGMNHRSLKAINKLHSKQQNLMLVHVISCYIHT